MTTNRLDIRSTSLSTYLVKGCPCLMEFGTEQVCINNDDVVPVYVMDISPEIAKDAIGDSEEDRIRTAGGDLKLCYSIVDIGQPDGQAYCALHGNPIRINNTTIRSADIEDAIQFVLFTEGESSSICSSCIYKYLVTMGGIFEEEITPTDAKLMIESFVSEIKGSSKSRNEESTGVMYRSVLRAHLRELVQEKKAWIQLVKKRNKSEIHNDHVCHELLQLYRKTSRMEMVLHHQLIALYDKEKGPRTQPRLIRNTAKHLLALCEKIHELDEQLLETSVPPETESLIRKHMANRERIEDGLKTLLSVLSRKRKQTQNSNLQRYSMDVGLI